MSAVAGEEEAEKTEWCWKGRDRRSKGDQWGRGSICMSWGVGRKRRKCEWEWKRCEDEGWKWGGGYEREVGQTCTEWQEKRKKLRGEERQWAGSEGKEKKKIKEQERKKGNGEEILWWGDSVCFDTQKWTRINLQQDMTPFPFELRLFPTFDNLFWL